MEHAINRKVSFKKLLPERYAEGLKQSVDDYKCGEKKCGLYGCDQFTIFDLSSSNYFIVVMGLGMFDRNRGINIRTVVDILDFNEDETLIDSTNFILVISTLLF